jgi:predicted CoA-binding protein
MMNTLFPEPRRPEAEPHALWFQPGAESDEIWQFVKARGIVDKVVIGDDACVLVSGDDALRALKKAPKAAL